jgi:hypothetical protein
MINVVVVVEVVVVVFQVQLKLGIYDLFPKYYPPPNDKNFFVKTKFAKLTF